MADHLAIEAHVRHEVGHVRVRGDLDLDTIGRLVAAVETSTPENGRIEIDLREVAFIDSAGVAGLNSCRRYAERVGASVTVLCREGGPVAKLLQWTGLARMLEVKTEP